MTISQFIKHSTLKAVVLSLASFGGLVINNATSFAVQVNFSSWQSFGDVTSRAGQANLTTNALQSDDFPQPDTSFNFSGTPAGEARPTPNLQNFLGVTGTALDIGGVAFEGSAIKNTITAQAGDVFSFNYNFLTNETSKPDYAFFLVNNTVTKLADITNASNVSSPFSKETGNNSFTYTFSTPGTYNLALGVVDINDYNNTSALKVSNANLQPVPEPLTILGSLTALGFGVGMRQRFRKQA
ncbi:hypothetical protein BZZ01_05405 [Nostocales cyanobacterium HT-58-2]|nr:hypothetical protein BZZ01_05405 [Nostocales cyanobacterium HT-58-2]